jgi:hypothetical protein
MFVGHISNKWNVITLMPMKRNIKQLWSTIPTITTKRTITSETSLTEIWYLGLHASLSFLCEKEFKQIDIKHTWHFCMTDHLHIDFRMHFCMTVKIRRLIQLSVDMRRVDFYHIILTLIMKEWKLIAETQDTIWILVKSCMIWSKLNVYKDGWITPICWL